MGYRADVADNGLECLAGARTAALRHHLHGRADAGNGRPGSHAPDPRAPERSRRSRQFQIRHRHRRHDRQRHAGRPRKMPRRRHGRLPRQARPARRHPHDPGTLGHRARRLRTTGRVRRPGAPAPPNRQTRRLPPPPSRARRWTWSGCWILPTATPTICANWSSFTSNKPPNRSTNSPPPSRPATRDEVQTPGPQLLRRQLHLRHDAAWFRCCANWNARATKACSPTPPQLAAGRQPGIRAHPAFPHRLP